MILKNNYLKQYQDPCFILMPQQPLLRFLASSSLLFNKLKDGRFFSPSQVSGSGLFRSVWLVIRALRPQAGIDRS